jgi:hypothetical protein
MTPSDGGQSRRSNTPKAGLPAVAAFVSGSEGRLASPKLRSYVRAKEGRMSARDGRA